MKRSRHFFAMLSRMKYISRWGLMRNTRSENLGEHSLETAVLAHGLAVIRNRRFGGEVDPQRAATLALFHDVPEILTGDLPTPVKYFNPKIREAYHTVEEEASRRLLSCLPADLAPDYEDLFFHRPQEEELWRIVKAADKLSALIKCVEEEKTGNREFMEASRSLRRSLEEMDLPEVRCFLKEFLPSYSLSLDEQDE